VLTPSEATRADLVALGFPEHRVTTVHNGIDAVFVPGGERSAVPLVLAVGRLAPVKRIDELIRAAAVAKERIPDLELIIVGEGPLRPALDAQITEMGARSWIVLLGRQRPERLAALYRRAWIVASSSLAEGWGLGIVEAAACGTPAVATDVSGHRSSVVDGVTGVLTDLGGLGPAIAELLADHATRVRLGAAAAQRAAAFSWDRSALGIVRALRDEVDRDSSP
jgi:glycosyltransferase involved in cell wall biosynthesis